MTFDIAVAFLLGAFTWTFMEYVIHRWLGLGPQLSDILCVGVVLQVDRELTAWWHARLSAWRPAE